MNKLGAFSCFNTFSPKSPQTRSNRLLPVFSPQGFVRTMYAQPKFTLECSCLLGYAVSTVGLPNNRRHKMMTSMNKPQAKKLVEALGMDYEKLIESGVNYFDSRMSSVTFFTNWSPVYGTFTTKQIVRSN